jgi:Ulp1 family protease
LNDEIINGYIELVKLRYEKCSPPTSEKLVFFNTYAYPKLSQLYNTKRIHQFDRILKKKQITEISQFDKLFIPVNIEKHHWLLLVVNLHSQEFEFYDSIQ